MTARRGLTICDGNASGAGIWNQGMASLNDRGEIKIVDYNGNTLWEYDYPE